jgi:preprotein translocase subunit SecG
MLKVALVALHVVICLFLILVVLLQTGKGAGLGAAFGGASDTMFGARGAGSFLSKLTTTVAVIFILTSLALATPYFSSQEPGTVVPQSAVPASPATPAAEKAPAQEIPADKK